MFRPVKRAKFFLSCFVVLSLAMLTIAPMVATAQDATAEATAEASSLPPECGNTPGTIKDLAAALPFVRGEPGEFQQVFFNLISNAIAAMKGGGVLTISTTPVDQGRTVEVRISDTGHGIKHEHRTKIFDPLFTTKKVGEGTGLGLSVTYGIITHHGGTITFETRTKEESESPGTTFIITLPAVKV